MMYPHKTINVINNIKKTHEDDPEVVKACLLAESFARRVHELEKENGELTLAVNSACQYIKSWEKSGHTDSKGVVTRIKKALSSYMPKADSPEGYRIITKEDFTDNDIIPALYIGNSDYLDHGRIYNIKYIEKRNKVSVPASVNQNVRFISGTEFGLKNFRVEISEPERNHANRNGTA